MRLRSAFLFLALPVLAVSLLAFNVAGAGYVFSKAQALSMYQKGALPSTLKPPFWAPTAVEASQAEDAVLAHLRSSKRYSRSRMVRMYDDYRHQYIGYTSHGRRCIYLNAFPRSDYPHLGKAWRERLISVQDGGESFFQVLIDFESRKVLEVRVNGEG
jgi:hypothetical protein